MAVNHLGKGFFFLWTTLPGRGWNMVSIEEVNVFLPQKSKFWTKNLFFLLWAPDFCQFVALNVAVLLAPLDRFFDFLFPSYGSFCEGTRSRNSPSALSTLNKFTKTFLFIDFITWVNLSARIVQNRFQ